MWLCLHNKTYIQSGVEAPSTMEALRTNYGCELMPIMTVNVLFVAVSDRVNPGCPQTPHAERADLLPAVGLQVCATSHS